MENHAGPTRWIHGLKRSLALLALVGFTAPALAAPPVVYHSEQDDGVPPAGAAVVDPAVSSTLYLYIDAGSTPTTQDVCHLGTGDDLCGWSLDFQGVGGLTIQSFTPAPGVTFHLDANDLGVVGGDPWRGELGPTWIGNLEVDGTAGGQLSLLSSTALDASLQPVVVAADTIVTLPEPGGAVGLVSGMLLLRWLVARRRRRRVGSAALMMVFVSLTAIPVQPARAQGSPVCGDVVADDAIDTQDLLAIRGFLAGDPAAPDFVGDADLRARCDVDENGLCELADWARIRRYMLTMPGGMDETCTDVLPSSVVLPAPSVAEGSSISTGRASVSLSGTTYFPTIPVQVDGALGRFSAVFDRDGTWRVEVPLALGQSDTLSVQQDFGFGQMGTPASVGVSQTQPAGGAALEGRIVDAATGEPIDEIATLSVSGLADASDDAGRILVEGLPYGQVVVRAEAPGYVPEVVLWDGAGKVRSYSDADQGEPELVIGLSPRADPVIVDSSGGTIVTPNGVELVVPAGALPAPTEIQLSDLYPRKRPGYSTRPIVEISGPIPIAFDPPAELRIPMDESLPPGTVLALARLDPATYALTSDYGIMAGDGYLSVEILSANAERVEGSYVSANRRWQRFDETHVTTVRYVTVGNCYQDTTVDFSLEQQIEFLGFQEAYDRFPETIGHLIEHPETIRGPLFDPTVPGLADLFAPADRINVYEITISSDVYRSDVYLYEPDAQGSSVCSPDGCINRPTASRVDMGEAIEYVPTFGVPVLVESYEIPCKCGSNPRYNGFVDEQAEEEIQSLSSGSAPPPAGSQCVAGSWGDPHLVRFDHVGPILPGSFGNGRYDFQAAGEFVLFESMQDAMTVQTRFVQFPARPSTTIAKATALDLEGDRVMVDIDASALRVRVEGVVNALPVGVPAVLPGGGELERQVSIHGQDVVVARWFDGSSLTITLSAFLGSEYLNLYPRLASPRFEEVQGLLGNANGVLGDDYNLRDGTPAIPAELYSTYADSWRISQAESLFDYEAGEDTTTYNGVPPDPELTLDDLDPADRAAAEAACIAAGIDEDPLFSECALDIAILGGAAIDGALETQDQIPDIGTLVAVSGEANIFQAGQSSPIDFGGGGGVGLLPTELPLDPGTGRTMRVLDRAGEVSFSAGATAMPLDGVDYGDVAWGSWADVAGPQLRRMGQLMGVFLDSGLPSPIPASFDCGAVDSLFAAPALGQVFCIGDGLSFANEPQTFLVPDAATRVFFGHAERLSDQVIESAVHHLGDNYGTAGLFALDPNPEGRCFNSNAFDIPTGFTPSSARVRLDLAGTDIGSNSLWVNGQQISWLPNTGYTTWLEDRAFTVNTSILLPTGNQITVCSNGVNLDDFLFKDLRFEVASPVSVLPEPSPDPTPYHLGCNCGQFIGDGVGAGNWGLFANMPIPYGTSWTSPPFAVESPSTLGGASVVIDIAQTDRPNNRVLVNGTVVGSLPVRPDGTVWSTDEEIGFDPALLKESGNRIEVRSGYLSPGLVEVDDFMMRNVRIAVAPEAAVPPGGYSDNTGAHLLIIEVSP